MKIEIEFLFDEYGCETCGTSFAEGASIKFDGEIAIKLLPYAHCYNGFSYDEREVFSKILEKLGHSVEYI